MSFKEECLEDFLEMFSNKKESIRNFRGCQRLELLADINSNNTYFTYSFWGSEADLDNYRGSDFFKETWRLTKSFFSERAEAWSTSQEHVLR